MNESNVSGKFDQVVGKIKQGVGEAVGNENLANQGAADQVKGNVKETWGDVKDATGNPQRSDAGSNPQTSSDTGHNVRDSITSAAENTKASVQNALKRD